MVKFEAIRIEPSPGEIVDLIAEAVVATNRRCRTRLLEETPAKWRKAAREIQKTIDGWEMWRAGRGGCPATQVMVSWWTDHIGRKHVVVRGRRAESNGDRVYLERQSLETRSALWHCYPARIYLRFTKSVTDWIAVCGCGAAGTPTSLGWMGETCGPCHDLKEERGELPAFHRMPSVLTGSKEELIRVTASDDGKYVAATDVGGSIHVWSLPDESHSVYRSEIAAIRRQFQTEAPIRSETLGFTGNSQHLIPDTLVRSFQLLGLDVSADPPSEFPLTAAGLAPVAVLPWIDGTFCRVWQDGLEWVDPTTREPIRRNSMPIGSAWQVIASPDCSRLFVRVGNRCTIIDPEDGQIITRPEIWDRDGFLYRQDFTVDITFSHDYKLIAIGLHNHINLIDGLTGRLIKNSLIPQFPFVKHVSTVTVSGLAFDATGQYLFVNNFAGTILVYSTADLSIHSGYQWHLGYTRALAISHDLKTIITGGTDGMVKFWPIERLMATVHS